MEGHAALVQGDRALERLAAGLELGDGALELGEGVVERRARSIGVVGRVRRLGAPSLLVAAVDRAAPMRGARTTIPNAIPMPPASAPR